MAKLIAVFGATGNQGGAVAKFLLQHPDHAYRVRAITRNPDAAAARRLRAHGAEVVQADLTVPETLAAAVQGCWGIFGVTNFYDGECQSCIYIRVGRGMLNYSSLLHGRIRENQR